MDDFFSIGYQFFRVHLSIVRKSYNIVRELYTSVHVVKIKKSYFLSFFFFVNRVSSNTAFSNVTTLFIQTHRVNSVNIIRTCIV